MSDKNLLVLENSADCLLSLLSGSSKTNYIGEAVSQLEHSIQAAFFSQENRHGVIVELAALFHDIGHFCNTIDEPEMDGLGIVNHEWIGARIVLERGLSMQIACLIGEHVNAKRYLSGKTSRYFNNLSPASRATLDFQGGPMSHSEIKNFESKADFKKILQVRINDEKGKVLNLKIPTLNSYRQKIIQSMQSFPHKTSTIKTIYFIRHAQATGQAPDAALTKQGLDHSHSLVHYFKDKNIQVILSSPYLRAMTTVEPIAHSKQLPIIPDYRLREFHPCADANDVHYETYQQKSFNNDRFVKTGGMSFKEVKAYVYDVLTSFEGSMLNKYIMVTHGRWLSALMKVINPDITYQEATSLTHPSVIKLNYDSSNQKYILKMDNFMEFEL